MEPLKESYHDLTSQFYTIFLSLIEYRPFTEREAHLRRGGKNPGVKNLVDIHNMKKLSECMSVVVFCHFCLQCFKHVFRFEPDPFVNTRGKYLPKVNGILIVFCRKIGYLPIPTDCRPHAWEDLLRWQVEHGCFDFSGNELDTSRQ